ncbi:hypothetical protein NDU88_001635 [Pleurodeles waltl]|uniref:Uncharacterized protein n=1 Tax=Pleurodeles waltl TaxID=8319 RepID=A0AAV7UWM0_PLEWA|nr:hypothetical protein NDU88_001635 [Pleurodeles waltl]
MECMVSHIEGTTNGPLMGWQKDEGASEWDLAGVDELVLDYKVDSDEWEEGVDRMTEKLDKHAERLDQSERCISEVENSQSTMSSGQAKISKELVPLQAKGDDLEARSHRNNLRIVGVAESTAIDIWKAT